MSLEAELTPGEKAYLESGGTDTAALMAENPSTPEPAPEPKVEAKVEAPVADTAKTVTDAPAANSELGEEEIPSSDGKTKRRVVDSRALKAEREARKAAEAELNKFRENYSRVDERLKMLSEAVATPETPAAPVVEEEIDPEADIFGAVKGLRTQLNEIRQGFSQQREATAAERQTAQVVTTYRQDAAAFTAKQPDFGDAYNFMLGVRQKQLEAQRYNPEEVKHWLYVEEMNLVNRALTSKQSPAADIYALAKSFGYTPKTADPAPAAGAAAPAAAPSAPLAAPAAPAVPSVTDEVRRIQAGQSASRSLSNGGGAAGEELSIEWLANATPAEFARFMDIPGNRDKVERAMGKAA